jgi:ParB family transcriptional regulator, chromosome partitioning protein
MTLLNRESAIARVASGEVRQVTQLLLDPTRVRIWPGNARVYGNLTEASWLCANNYAITVFVAQVQALDDECSFRLADLENRARKDVSDLERARNYADAPANHYGGHQKQMADRLNLSKGWLSKMLKVASIPESVVAAFASPDELQLKPAYPLAQALDQPNAAISIAAAAAIIAVEREDRQIAGLPPTLPQTC